MNVLRLILFPLSLIYGFIIIIRNYLYDHDLLRTYKIGCKVISVGNLSLGGTGKTPLVIHFARYLKEKGERVVVLSRGYKGTQSKKEPFVVSDGVNLFGDAKQSGDEAFLIAKSTDVPVIVGKDRVLSARLSLSRFQPDYLILDDGFQHRRLCRDVDIVLLSPFDQIHIFPAGNLREPLSSLKRASIVGITKGSIADLDKRVKNCIKNKKIIEIKYSISSWKVTGRLLPLNSIKNKKAIVMSAIGQFDYFLNQVRELGASILDRISFPDHHHYIKEDLAKAEEQAQKISADAIIITEKDFVKLESIGPLNEKYWTAILSVMLDNTEDLLSNRCRGNGVSG